MKTWLFAAAEFTAPVVFAGLLLPCKFFCFGVYMGCTNALLYLLRKEINS